MSEAIEVLKVVGGSGAAAIITAALFLRVGRGKANGKGNGGCPIPEHEAKLAAHGEAIQTLKDGQAVIFRKLDNLPTEIADAVHRRRS